MRRGGLDVAVGPKGAWGFARTVVYPDSIGASGVAVGVGAPGPCVVESIVIDSDEGDLTNRYYPMAFSTPLQSVATSDLEPALAAGLQLLSRTGVDRRGVVAWLGGFGDPRRMVFWPRAVVPWGSWWPGIVVRQVGVFLSTPIDVIFTCRLVEP